MALIQSGAIGFVPLQNGSRSTQLPVQRKKPLK
jgi:hypothetical protein